MTESAGIAHTDVRLDELREHSRNYNRHSPAQIARIAKSLQTFGQVRSIVVWRKVILAGHGVVLAARQLGWQTLRADVVDGLSESEALAYVVADNELARQSDPDQEQLAAILQELNQFDTGLVEAAGYGQQELEQLLRLVNRPEAMDDAEGQIEDFPVADLLAPYPYFGGKRAIAGAVWARFGDVSNYVEPFFGSGAMLLSRPSVTGVETVNDLDGFVANFWRAVATCPDEVAHYCDWPVNENDLFARHLWLVQQRATLTERLHSDPDYCDAKIAGWWCWGCCGWIGTGWCDGDGPWQSDGESVSKLPHLGDPGRGVNRQLPHLGNPGQGGTANQCAAWSEHLRAMMQALSDRLRRVRVACGDWSRVVTGSVTDRHGLTGVFLDPPYAAGAMEYSAGGNQDDVLSEQVRAWCVQNGANPQLRIAFCGYEPLTMPSGWRALRWTAPKGYQNAENEANRRREIIWFSPACLAATGTHPVRLGAA